MSSLVTTREVEQGIFELRMEDAEGQNCLGEALCRQFATAIEGLRTEPSLRVLLLSGRKDVFCSGASLDGLDRLQSGAVHVADVALPEQIIGFPVPIIAVLEGHAVGGGMTLALCCDVLVASESSRYGANFTTMGFTPGMGTTALLPAIVGHHLAMEMMLTGKFYRGAELRGHGVFNHVVPSSEVADVALDIARRMAEKPRHVLEMTKDTLSLPRRRALHEGISREHLMHEICFKHPDIKRLIEENYLAGRTSGAPGGE